MAQDFALNFDIPDEDMGIVSAPSSSATPAVNEDAPIAPVDDENINPRAPFNTDIEAKNYFNTVTEEEALNYILMLHDVHAITFDRFTSLKDLLDKTPSFLPKGNSHG